jgi:DNA topoisomerase-1
MDFNFNIDLFNYLVYNQFGGKINEEAKWTTFKHNGVLFPEPYVPHGIPLIYTNISGIKEEIILDPLSEEYATIYAKFLDTEYIKNKLFNKNFFNDWKIFLKKNGFSKIISLENCDFSHIYKYIIKEKEKKNNILKEEKEKLKKEKEKFENKFKIALINNKEQEVGNFRIEPPGIFLGRGCHPKAGKIKKRILPEDITINIDKLSPIPELPPFYKDRKWKKVIHDNTLEWVASWKDNITGKIKYVWMGNKSDFKAKSDLTKFEKARKLSQIIDTIRRNNMNNIMLEIKGSSESRDEIIKLKQLATALYLIDNFALRVGNEKGEDEADTVGVCSLRVEHLELLENNEIKLDFLGKDSIRYINKVKIDQNVYKNIEEFLKGKKKNENIFDKINTSLLNEYLKTMDENLTAKVFRTYNASKLFQEEINEINDKINKIKDNDNKLNLILDLYNKANLKVALLCNHQKNVSKKFNEQINNFNDRITKLMKQKNELLANIKTDLINNDNKKIKQKIKKIERIIKDLKSRKNLKIELKNISLSTSKINYIDPRITIAFLKKHNLPIEKIFSQALIDKFFWAMDVDEKWQF